MTNEEFDKLCEELMAQGMKEEDILAVILQMFKDGKINIDEMSKLAGARGYELTEEFLEKETPKTPAPEALNNEEFTEEEVEDAQEVEPEEKSEESEEESEPESEEETKSEEEDEESEEDEEESDEEDEKEEARKYFF